MLAYTIKCFQLSGFPLTIGRVCQLAFQYASVNGIIGFSDERQMAGHKWLSGFLKCHPDISLKKASNLSIARAMGANPTVTGQWYSLLKEVMDIMSPKQISTKQEYRTFQKKLRYWDIERHAHSNKCHPNRGRHQRSCLS